EVDGARAAGLGVGAIAGEYFTVFHQPRFVLGGPPSADAGAWAVISDEWASELAKARGRPLASGEKITLSVVRNQTFTIREATLAGVVHYEPANAALDHLVVTDGRILRALCGYSQTDASAGAPGAPGAAAPAGGQDADIDALFSGGNTSAPADRTRSSSAPISVDELKDLLRQARTAGASAENVPLAHDGAWHFILLRLAAGASKARAAADLRRELSGAGFSVQVRDWRGTAGGAATYVFLMQIVLYVGIFMLGGIVLILTINSLVMSVFERTSEIGTMRAIGARRGFVQRLFIVETSALTLISGVAGMLAGFVLVAVLDHVPLKLTNQILVLLFGGTSLHPGISAWNALVSVLAALVLGLVAWIYPVRLALRIQPVRAIHAS
ncbi:MAG TPA: FtsX-like permease family protein, partial [Spirochaetia bacterium]|nr:FtsX-like permease family protein [Spirochaetia bacterium]